MNLSQCKVGANTREIASRISPSVEFLRKSNVFQSGRQLERTPPVSEVKRTLVLHSSPMKEVIQSKTKLEAGQSQNHPLNRAFEMLETRDENSAPPNREVSPAYDLNVNRQHQRESCRASSTCTVDASEEDPNLLIRGMVGYQWTPADLNFIKTMKEEKKVKELQEELAEKQRLLKMEMKARDLSYASRVEIQDKLNKLLALGKDVLSRKRSEDNVNGLSPRSLFVQIKTEDVQLVLEEERTEITELEEKLIQDLDLRLKEECAEAERLEQRIAEKQKRISWLRKELSILQSQLETTEETTQALRTEMNILKSEKMESEGHVVKEEALQVTPVQRKVQEKIRKKVDEQPRSEVLQVTQIKQQASEGSKPSGNEHNTNSQEVSQISTNHARAHKGVRQAKKKATEAHSLGDKSKVDSLKGPKTVKYEESGEIAHASTTQGSSSKIPQNNKKKGGQSTSKVVSQSAKTTRSTFKGHEATGDGGKGHSQVTLPGTRSTTKAAKTSKKANLPEGSQTSTKPKAAIVPTGTEHTRSMDTAVTLKRPLKKSTLKVAILQDNQTRSNSVHFQESTTPLQSQETVQLGISPAKNSKVLRKTRKTRKVDGGSQPTEASQGSTKPKVQAPKAATSMKAAGRLLPTEGVRRSKRIASRTTTVK